MSTRRLLLLALAASLRLTTSHRLVAEDAPARTLVHAGVLFVDVSFVMKDGIVYRD